MIYYTQHKILINNKKFTTNVSGKIIEYQLYLLDQHGLRV